MVQGEGWDRGRGWDWERMSNVSLKLKTGTRGCQNCMGNPILTRNFCGKNSVMFAARSVDLE